MKKFIIIAFLLSNTPIALYCLAPYILCIDGGGSKTALQVINDKGVVLTLVRQGVNNHQIESSGSNINTVGSHGVKEALRDLIEETILENDKSLHDILPVCLMVAGMAGIGAEESKNAVIELFEELGIHKDRLLLTTDAALALQLVPGDGAILIAGTGSICLGKKDTKSYRVGGLGYLLGDEGSGYAIGLQALKAALAHEYGWGMPTDLTDELRKHYNVEELKSVMLALYKNKITPAQISRATPIVLEQAIAQDAQAVAIVDNAAKQLCELATTMAIFANLSDCQIHLWGGLFKSKLANNFIKNIQQHSIIQQRGIVLVNQANQNSPTLFAQQYLCNGSESQDTLWQSAKKLFGAPATASTANSLKKESL